MTIREIKEGEFFTLKPIDNPKESQVYVRGPYDRSSRKYSAVKFSDINSERLFPADREVYVDFTF